MSIYTDKEMVWERGSGLLKFNYWIVEPEFESAVLITGSLPLNTVSYSA